MKGNRAGCLETGTDFNDEVDVFSTGGSSVRVGRSFGNSFNTVDSQLCNPLDNLLCDGHDPRPDRSVPESLMKKMLEKAKAVGCSAINRSSVSGDLSASTGAGAAARAEGAVSANTATTDVLVGLGSGGGGSVNYNLIVIGEPPNGWYVGAESGYAVGPAGGDVSIKIDLSRWGEASWGFLSGRNSYLESVVGGIKSVSTTFAPGGGVETSVVGGIGYAYNGEISGYCR